MIHGIYMEKLGGFTIANVDPSGRDEVDLLDQRTADMLVVLGVSENGGYTWWVQPKKKTKGSSKRPWKEIFWDSQLTWVSMLFPAAYHFLYSLPFPAVLPQKSWCPAQGQMVGLNHAAWNTESFRANHITFRRSWSNFWGI